MLERPDSAATRTLFQEGRRNGELVGEADTRKAAARIFAKIAADYVQKCPDRRRHSTEGAGVGDYGRALACPTEEGEKAAAMSVSKSEPDPQLRSLIEFGTMHARGAKIDWWTSALDTVAAHAAGCTERYDEFLWSLQRYVVGVNETPFSLLLRRPLTDPQKWLIMVTIDEFLDQDIIPKTFDHWHKIWRYAANMYGCAFLYLQTNPNLLSSVTIQDAWYRILAASS